MLKNYFKIALRNLWKNKAYTSINIVGLSIAFGCAILLFLTAYFEFTYDDFQANKDRIFRTYFKINQPEKIEYQSNLSTPLTPALKSDFNAEIKYATRIVSSGVQIVQGEKTIDEDIRYVDADFLKMFSFKMLKGNPDIALNDLRSVVLNEEVAEKIFDKADPVGKTVQLNFGGRIESFVVTGVMEKAPKNSSIENDMLMRFENNPEYKDSKEKWDSNYHDVYVQLADKVDYLSFERRLKSFTEKYYKGSIEQLKKDGAKPDERGEVRSLRLLPMPEMHFNKQAGGSRSIDIAYPYILLVISGLVLLIACINFINLSIARSMTRAKEVGMRKALGALKAQIVGQFWGEAFIICILAFGIGCVLATTLMPQYNTLFRSNLTFENLLSPMVGILLLSSFLIITLIAGGYPALAVAKFNTVEVLKGKIKVSSRSGGIRSALIVAQFSIAILLISCTLIIWKQIDYLRNQPLGFNQTQVISIPVGNEVQGGKVLEFMRNKLANESQIVSITGADINIGRGKDGSGYKSVYSFEMEGKTYRTNGLSIDYDYVKTLGLTLVAGREFSREFPSDKDRACIVNETMVKQLGYKDPIGKKIGLGDSLGKTIVGVVKDYHFESLKNKIEAITFLYQGDFGVNYIFVKLTPETPKTTIDLIGKVYKEIAPKSEYMPSFLDENTDNQYKKEERMSQIVMSAATLTIILSCMGLFAIALMMMAQRTKEIGIRKVLGASVPNLVALLSKEFVVLVLIAILIATPLAYYLMNKWIQDFAYRTEITWWVFGLAGVVALLIALFTVSYQSIRAALMNPVRSLKSE
ncbi:ABC transporter permease [Emticicia sp. C21]|uniref:ABC transporter permease n=1 Tax=Emticicia sp. C21 TaxID=2302915 RepID=UPI000E34F01A|nr:ABC transporter permease [Emticicia sp. C21]RFS16305.1 ABC transporter permease [Emticicia sp. C21]